MTEGSQEILSLNQKYGIPDRIEFRAGPGGLTTAYVSTSHANAAVSLLGAHVLDYRPIGQPAVLWMSQSSWFETGKPIRGGIPLCWPWFGAHLQDPAQPLHGFVRLIPWQVYDSRMLPGDVARLTFRLADSPQSHVLFPHPFEIRLTVEIGTELVVGLWMRNPGGEGYEITGALHSYFSVGDAAQIQIDGLDKTDYLDKVENFNRKSQAGSVKIEGQTDRVYLDTGATCQIVDPVLGRKISIAKSGSRTTVVWNPWVERAKVMPDFRPDEYSSMVCVETANAADDKIFLPSGGEHLLQAVIRSEPL